VPSQFSLPNNDALISIEHCPTAALQSNNFAFLCSASASGPGLLLGYVVPSTATINSAEQTVSQALTTSGWTVDSTAGTFDQLTFNGFGYQGWFEAFASKPNLDVYLQPTSSQSQPPTSQPIAVTVPNVVGQLKDQAVQDLTVAGLNDIVTDDPSNPVPFLGAPVVEYQSPSAGSLLSPGSVVTLTVGAG
jgi:hypothetical protein